MLDEQKLKAEQLYIKYWHLMCHVAMEILQNSTDAEQAFLYLMLHMDRLGDIDSPATKAYVVLTAKHRAIDLYRSRRRCEPADISGMRAAGIHPERLGVMEAPHEERRHAEGHLAGKKEALRKIGGELKAKKNAIFVIIMEGITSWKQ